MNGEYQWWLLAVVAAAALGIFWLLRGTIPRREVDVETSELAAEARWISRRLQAVGDSLPDETIERILDLHRSYLDEPPPGAPLETELMPLPGTELMAQPGDEATAAEAVRRAERQAGRGTQGDRSRRARQSEAGQPELPPVRYRESRSGG